MQWATPLNRGRTHFCYRWLPFVVRKRGDIGISFDCARGTLPVLSVGGRRFTRPAGSRDTAKAAVTAFHWPVR